MSTRYLSSCTLCGWEQRFPTPSAAAQGYRVHPCLARRDGRRKAEVITQTLFAAPEQLALPAAPEPGGRAREVEVYRFIPPGGGEPIELAQGPIITTAADAAGNWLLRYADSVNTFRAYERTQVEWFAFCAAARVDPLTARSPLVDAYKAWLSARGLAASSIVQRLVTLSSFYTYCCDQQVLSHNPVRGVRRPKLTDEPRSTGLETEQLRRFLAASEQLHPMIHAVTCLLAFNGLRASEPGSINADDLATVRGHRTVAVLRKARAEKTRLPLAPVTAAALDAWLPLRAEFVAQHADEFAQMDGGGPLFLTFARAGRWIPRYSRLQAKAPERRVVWNWVRAIRDAAGLDVELPRLHPHDARHAFVTLSLDAGVPFHQVQDSADHRSPVTTQRYNRHRNRLDDHATYRLAEFVAPEPPQRRRRKPAPPSAAAPTTAPAPETPTVRRRRAS